MPIYEYECGKCGVFEHSQRITEAPLAKCPTCRRKVRRLISSTSFQLKGSGWYVTDYARGGKKGGAEGAGETKSADATKSDSTSDTSKSEKKTTSEPKAGSSSGSGGKTAAAS
jgi:putative FmdB family regulatory protein